MKSSLVALAHRYSNIPVDHSDFVWNITQFKTMKALKSNTDIYMCKPDKGAGVVILDKSDYVEKMAVILNDVSKFRKLGPVELTDNTCKNEAKMQRRLLALFKKKVFCKDVYDRIRPSGSQRPRMYGLPQIHKQGVPLKPFLSMVGSAQHSLAQWLVEILQPVRELYTTHCIPDSFQFVDYVLNAETSFMCSFDVSSLFTTIPLDETIRICTDALYDGRLTAPRFSKEILIELILMCTKCVEFSFCDIMYCIG